MCIHPDDPPRPLFGLPRIVSTEEDIAFIAGCGAIDANGLTLCTGSLGAGAANDLPAIARRFADRIHFVHLRNVSKEPDGSFMEADHLGGDIDMVARGPGAAGRAERGARRPAMRIGGCRSGPTTATRCWTTSASATHPGYPRSAACAAWRKSAA